jgi:hypothetical protein
MRRFQVLSAARAGYVEHHGFRSTQRSPLDGRGHVKIGRSISGAGPRGFAENQPRRSLDRSSDPEQLGIGTPDAG